MSDRLREIKMDELKNMFFYTFGIVPLDSYGVVGDGMTDNRLAIQQAIYDGIEVGAKYIFVPKGEYYYSKTLNDLDKVVFIGNSTEAVINGIDIKQFPDLWGAAQSSTAIVTPIGGIILYAGKIIPESYIECKGQKLNTIDYTTLYEVLNGNTEEEKPETFTIPNLTTGNSTTKYIIRVK